MNRRRAAEALVASLILLVGGSLVTTFNQISKAVADGTHALITPAIVIAVIGLVFWFAFAGVIYHFRGHIPEKEVHLSDESIEKVVEQLSQGSSQSDSGASELEHEES